MNKAELVEFIAEEAELTKASAERALNACLNAIMTSLKKNEPVTLPKFGAFIVKERAARTGRNPHTGQAIEIKASRVVAFKAGKGLKDAVKDEEKELVTEE